MKKGYHRTVGNNLNRGYRHLPRKPLGFQANKYQPPTKDPYRHDSRYGSLLYKTNKERLIMNDFENTSV